MIGQVTPHGRTGQDGRNLVRHVIDKEPAARLQVMNSLGSDLPDVIREMEIMRDGTRAESAYLHIIISPGTALDDDGLRKAAQIVMKHFDAEDHPAALVFHDKKRNGGAGDHHGHLVLGRVGPDGKPLASGFEKIRLETAMRIVEFEMGEPPVLGEHYASSVRWLRKNGRDDVADRLESVFGGNPDRPRSAASPSKRQALERQGVNLSAARESVKAAWSAADGVAAFHAAMAEKGLTVIPGEKTGVFIVRAGDIEVGALDRILGEKRKAVAERMARTEEKKNDVASPAQAHPSEERAADRRDDPQPDQQGRADRHEDLVVGRPGLRLVDGGSAGGGRGPDRSASTDARLHPGPRLHDRITNGHPVEPRKNGQARALARAKLRRHDWASTRERAKPAVVKISERLDRAEREMAFRLAKARRIEPPSFMAKVLRDSVAKFDAELQKAQEAREAAWLDMLAAKKALPNKFWARSPFEWFARWQRYSDALKALERAGEVRDIARAAATEKRRVALPALDQDSRERRDKRDAAVAAVERQNADDRLLIAAARQVLRDDPGLALKGLKAVLEEAARRLEQQDAHRLALERRATFRVVARAVEPEPSTTYGPR